MGRDQRLAGGLYGRHACTGSIAFFTFIRLQTTVADGQFLRSMIPHHSSAILMCREASLQDHEIRDLCRNITSGQQQEIDQMNAILRRLQ